VPMTGTSCAHAGRLAGVVFGFAGIFAREAPATANGLQ
jgi:hypothetical protein